MSVGGTDPTLPAVPAAAGWLAAVMTGSGATIVAVLAIAALGLLMLTGRVPIRRGGVVVIGCFVLFAAQALASALLGTAVGGRDVAVVSTPPPPPAYRPAVPAPVPYDPYAGASVPQQAVPQQPLR